jgi:hypothetical protein
MKYKSAGYYGNSLTEVFRKIQMNTYCSETLKCNLPETLILNLFSKLRIFKRI